jgi:hypothetical protein
MSLAEVAGGPGRAASCGRAVKESLIGSGISVPGGGLVFLIAGGLTYEMAPKTWSSGTEDPGVTLCDPQAAPGPLGTDIGTGSSNTSALVAGCSRGAGNDAAAYGGGGFTDWFLPSKNELNALYS